MSSLWSCWVFLPLHTKQQVSGTETGEEQVIGWHVFRAQKMFPFWDKKGRQNSLLLTFQSMHCRRQVFQGFSLSLSVFISLRITDTKSKQHNHSVSDVLKHSSKNITRYYIYLVLIQNKLHFLLPHKDTLIQVVAWPPCKVLFCSLEKNSNRTIEPAALPIKGNLLKDLTNLK